MKNSLLILLLLYGILLRAQAPVSQQVMEISTSKSKPLQIWHRVQTPRFHQINRQPHYFRKNRRWQMTRHLSSDGQDTKHGWRKAKICSTGRKKAELLLYGKDLGCQPKSGLSGAGRYQMGGGL